MKKEPFYSNTIIIAILSGDDPVKLKNYLNDHEITVADNLLNRLLDDAAERGATKCCLMLGNNFIKISSTENRNALAWSAEEGHLETFKALISLGIKPEDNGGYVFINALNQKQFHICDFLSERFIDNNETISSDNTKEKVLNHYLLLKKITPIDYLSKSSNQYRHICLALISR